MVYNVRNTITRKITVDRNSYNTSMTSDQEFLWEATVPCPAAYAGTMTSGGGSDTGVITTTLTPAQISAGDSVVGIAWKDANNKWQIATGYKATAVNAGTKQVSVTMMASSPSGNQLKAVLPANATSVRIIQVGEDSIRTAPLSSIALVGDVVANQGHYMMSTKSKDSPAAFLIGDVADYNNNQSLDTFASFQVDEINQSLVIESMADLYARGGGTGGANYANFTTPTGVVFMNFALEEMDLTFIYSGSNAT